MNQEKARAYLKRIGFEEPVEKDEKTLDRLLRAHLEQVPFENLDVIHLGKVPSLETLGFFRISGGCPGALE